MKTQWTQLDLQIKKRRGELTKLQNFVQNIEVVKSDLRELNLQLETALEHMPHTFDVPGLLDRIRLRPSDPEISRTGHSGGLRAGSVSART